jgi:8-oxo-dGTP pyrophosphatase MutT (NUDIX family)
MGNPKLGKSSKGKEMHYSVGIFLKKDNKYLLIDRKKFPFGYSVSAGHVDEGETPEQTLIRETKEELGLDVKNYKLIWEGELDFDTCRRGISCHYFYLFEIEAEGEVKIEEDEIKGYGWFNKEEARKLKLTPAAEYFFNFLKDKL